MSTTWTAETMKVRNDQVRRLRGITRKRPLPTRTEIMNITGWSSSMVTEIVRHGMQQASGQHTFAWVQGTNGKTYLDWTTSHEAMAHHMLRDLRYCMTRDSNTGRRHALTLLAVSGDPVYSQLAATALQRGQFAESQLDWLGKLAEELDSRRKRTREAVQKRRDRHLT